MAADKVSGQTQFFNLPVDLALYASHVSNDAAGLYDFPEKGQIGEIGLYRRAEKNIIALGKFRVKFPAGFLDHALSKGFLQRGPGVGRSHEGIVRVKFAQGPGDGAADQSKADKTYVQGSHQRVLPERFMYPSSSPIS